MFPRSNLRRMAWLMALTAVCPLSLRAAERVTLVNGFTVDCLRHEAAGSQTRLFLPAADGGDSSYMEVAAAAIVRVEVVPDAPPAGMPSPSSSPTVRETRSIPSGGTLSAAAMHPLLAHAGEAHRVDEDLLASVVRAESGGQTHAVSRTGAQGLMQLMPRTATQMGVSDAFEPGQNVNGGAAYLDRLLLRYHDDIALALAAYNAGPGAVDRYRGVPPYRETRAYVAKVIREFNRRKLAGMMASNRELQ